MRKILICLALICAGASVHAEEITTGEWQLLALNGGAVVAETTFALDASGGVSGKAACNHYFGSNQAALPAVSFRELGATRMLCDRIDAETAYLAALSSGTAAELRDGHLILTGQGVTLEFVRDRGDKALICQTCG